MSAFLEEYGKVIVVIIVIAALIGIAVLFKKTGTDNATKSFTGFMTIAGDSVNEAQQAANNTANSQSGLY